MGESKFHFLEIVYSTFHIPQYSTPLGLGRDWCANPGLHPGLAMLNPFRVPEKETISERSPK